MEIDQIHSKFNQKLASIAKLMDVHDSDLVERKIGLEFTGFRHKLSSEESYAFNEFKSIIDQQKSEIKQLVEVFMGRLLRIMKKYANQTSSLSTSSSRKEVVSQTQTEKNRIKEVDELIKSSESVEQISTTTSQAPTTTTTTTTTTTQSPPNETTSLTPEILDTTAQTQLYGNEYSDLKGNNFFTRRSN